MPEDWSTVVILCPPHKNGNVFECRNFLSIALLSTGYKVFAHILFNKLKPYF